MGSADSKHECDEDEVGTTHRAGTSANISKMSRMRPVSAKQVRNRLGGYVWEVSDKARLQRFLFLGSDTANAYHATPFDPTRDDASCIERLIEKNRGLEVVDLLLRFSQEGRAAKQQPTIFALAVCARSNDERTKKAAYAALNQVCRIPTHLFLFVKYAEELSTGTGWGRAHKRAVSEWYEQKASNVPALARLLTKYNSREGWCHKDLFRLAHIKPKSDVLKVAVRFIMAGLEAAKELAINLGNSKTVKNLVKYLEATHEAKRCTSESRLVGLIHEHGLEREHLPTEFLNSPSVWRAFVQTMQMTAIVRNLGNLTSLGICDEDSVLASSVVAKLKDNEALKSARVHPFDVLVALDTYRKGYGDNGNLNWIPNPEIVDALDKAYYMAFKSVKPTGKRYCLAVDVSGSMNVLCMGSPVTCHVAAAAMVMVTARTEEHFKVMAFSHKLEQLNINSNDKLSDVIEKTSDLAYGGTDCALPMLWAGEKNEQFDVFIVYTDSSSETWFGEVHPAKALKDYREKMGIPNAKLIVVGMASNGFTIADQDDFGMLDVVGFDSGATQTIAKFSLGEI